MLNTSFKKNSKFCPYYYVKVYIIFLENCHLKYKILFYLALGFFYCLFLLTIIDVLIYIQSPPLKVKDVELIPMFIH
jgi:hypothetical protein